MGLYSRRQLVLLLLLVAAAGAGLAVGQWRRAHPDLAERLEQLDRAPVESPRPGSPASRERAAKRDATAGEPLDLNLASSEQLQTLPGVGAALARRIVEAREHDGPFESVDDLRRVRGVSRAKLDRLRPFFAVPP